MIVLRLFLRFIIVPLGYLAASIAATCVILFGSWKAGTMMLSENPDTATAAFFGALVAGPVLLVVLLATMWMPASIGILISEALRDPLVDLPCAQWRDLRLDRLATGRQDRRIRRADERPAICARRGARRRLRLLGGRGLERGVLEAGVRASVRLTSAPRRRSLRPPRRSIRRRRREA